MADVYVALELPGMHTRSVTLENGDPTFAPRRTPIDGGLAVAVLPTNHGWSQSGVGVSVSGRWQRTRWVGEASEAAVVDVARAEVDVLWVRWLGERELVEEGMSRDLPYWTPMITLGAGAGAAVLDGDPAFGAHGEASLGVSLAIGQAVSGLARVRATGFFHPWGYTRFDAGPTRNWSPSEAAVTVQLGLLF